MTGELKVVEHDDMPNHVDVERDGQWIASYTHEEARQLMHSFHEFFYRRRLTQPDDRIRMVKFLRTHADYSLAHGVQVADRIIAAGFQTVDLDRPDIIQIISLGMAHEKAVPAILQALEA